MFLAEVDVSVTTHFSTHEGHLLGHTEACDGNLFIRVAFQMENNRIVAADE